MTSLWPWSIPNDLEIASLRWFRDGWSAEGYAEMEKLYTHDERLDAQRRLAAQGFAVLDTDVDYEGVEWVSFAALQPLGKQRLAALEASSIVRRRRLGRAARWFGFIREYKWIGALIAGLAASPILQSILSRIGH